jgi:hypothetical protein
MPRSRTAGFVLVPMIIVAASATASGQTPVTTPSTQTVSTGTTKSGPTGATTETSGSGATGTTTTSSTGASKPAAESNSKPEEAVALVIVGLGAIALLLAYLFYDRWRKSYQMLAASALSLTDRFPRTEFNPVENAVFRARGVAADAAQGQPIVEGPTALAVGETVIYKASINNAPATSCTWAVEPADSATVQPTTGTETKLTAMKEGSFTLKATVGAGSPTLVHLTALAKAMEGGIPLLGVGFAGVAATIIAFTLAGALTALNILSGSAFIAFLGPVVGYFFAATRSSGQGGGSSGGT